MASMSSLEMKPEDFESAADPSDEHGGSSFFSVDSALWPMLIIYLVLPSIVFLFLRQVRLFNVKRVDNARVCEAPDDTSDEASGPPRGSL